MQRERGEKRGGGEIEGERDGRRETERKRGKEREGGKRDGEERGWRRKKEKKDGKSTRTMTPR